MPYPDWSHQTPEQKLETLKAGLDDLAQDIAKLRRDSLGSITFLKGKLNQIIQAIPALRENPDLDISREPP